MRLDYLLKGYHILEQQGEKGLEVTGLATDSRDVKKGYLFVALKGYSQDGHRYLAQAVENGAQALVVEKAGEAFAGVTMVRVSDTRAILPELAARFYDYPANGLNLTGITGTNGKTTTSYLLESIVKEAGKNVGVIGTINYRFGGREFKSSLTTPESTDLMRILSEMRGAGVTDVIVEVSSHSLDQGRTRGLNWSRAIFTSFSRDHLDYHSTMEEYFSAKSLLFDSLGGNKTGDQAVAVINSDDPKGTELEERTKVPVLRYGLGDNCSVSATHIVSAARGLRFRLVTPSGDVPVTSSLPGRINVYNILAAAATALSCNIGLTTIAEGVRKLGHVPGRLQPVKNKKGLSVFVDYAHTPDALEKALQTLKQLTGGRLITVFGCGGDRDKGKRPEMGRVAGTYSDYVIITSDNPRTEDPAEIIRDIEPGVRASGLERSNGKLASQGRCYEITLDRREAIRNAIDAAGKHDMVLIAGKGHEDYQIIGKETRHFDDVEEVALAAS